MDDETVDLPGNEPDQTVDLVTARRRYLRPVLATVGAIALLAVGVVIGSTWTTHAPTARHPADGTPAVLTPSIEPTDVPAPPGNQPNQALPPEDGTVLLYRYSGGDLPNVNTVIGPFQAPGRWTITYTWDCSGIAQHGISFQILPEGGSFLNIELDDTGQVVLGMANLPGTRSISAHSVCPYDFTITTGRPDPNADPA
jgi:hypothetical protein